MRLEKFLFCMTLKSGGIAISVLGFFAYALILLKLIGDLVLAIVKSSDEYHIKGAVGNNA